MDLIESIERRKRAGRLAALILCAIFLLAALPLIVRQYDRGRGAMDQNEFHLLAIRAFARQWPRPDFSDYPSATTPGYHLLLALVDRNVSDDVRVLRAVGALFTLGLLATLGLAVGRRTDALTATLLCLPVVCSLYVFSSGAWLLPDNAAWWGVLAVLLIALQARFNVFTLIVSGVVLYALVLVRQVHLWTAGVLCVSAWMGDRSDLWPTGHAKENQTRTGAIRVGLMLAAILPSVIILAAFFRMWHGTTPPQFQTVVGGGNPAIPATILAVFGMAGIFFVGFQVKSACAPDHRARFLRWIMLGALVGAMTAILPVTTYNINAGRWSGVWNLVPHFPTFAGRSPVILGLSTVGGGLLAGWLALLPPRDRWIFATAWAGFIASQATGALAWQRYYEPFVLIVLALMASRVQGRDQTPRWALAGPVLLSIMLSLVTFQSLRAQ